MTEAAIAEISVTDNNDGGDVNEERSLASDAWRTMRRNPLFWVSAGLIKLFVLMAIWPSLFTSTDPTNAILAKSRERPGADAWFGREIQGYDIYARCIYGARASILVGVLCTLGTVLIGGVIGVISGYQGGWADSLMSRIGDVFFAIPLLLGATINLGAYISLEATLSCLGIGLQPPAISWGIDINAALVGLRTTPHM